MKKLDSYLYDLQRFGLTPDKIFAQVTGQKARAPRILTVTMPKSGTNLLQRILLLHPWLSRAILPTLGRRNAEKWKDARTLLGKIGPGRVVSSHFDFDIDLARLVADELSYRVLLMIRDPRDAVLSDMHYIRTWSGHPQKSLIEGMATDKDRLMALIRGQHGVRPIREQIMRFSGWADHAHLIRFEDAVGAAGGGSDETQRQVIRGIYDAIGVPLADDKLEYIARNSRSAKTQTFRTGKIRNWEKVFDDDLRKAFTEEAGDLLISLGYEKDLNW